MKKIISALIGSAMLLVFTTAAFATLVDNNTNRSAEWTRMNARVASADSLDAVIYNPAGTVRMEDGLYFSLSNQFLPKMMKHEALGKEFETTTTTYIIPGYFALYKKGDWAGFMALDTIGGGGVLEYKDGIIATESTPTKPNPYAGKETVLSLAYLGFNVGGAYALNDMVSVSVTGRVVYAYVTGELDYVANTPYGPMEGLDYKQTAVGFGGIFGLDVAPVKGLLIGLRLDTPTRLNFEVDKSEGALAAAKPDTYPAKGSKVRRDHPMMTAIGISYMLTPELKLAWDFNYAWNKLANWEGLEDEYDNGFETSAGVEFAVLDNFKVSGGYTYVDAGGNVNEMEFLNPRIPYHSIFFGFMVEPVKDLQFNVGATKMFYVEKTSDRASKTGVPAGTKYDKDLWIIGIGVQYRVF